MSANIADNLARVKSQIRQLAIEYARQPAELRLLAVSKTFSASRIQLAYAAGQRAFGENYVDDALPKINALSELEIEWHYIGPIQSNKTRKIAENFQWVHSLASLKHAKRLNDQRPKHMPPLNICIQTNISKEATKSGLPTDAVNTLAVDIQNLPGLRLRGIMGIPAKSTDVKQQRRAFAKLAAIYQRLQTSYNDIDTLSMGMSGDLEAAIAEGSTMLRIGTAIFGARLARNL